MLDTIFSLAVIVASLCGVFIICLGLYDEWASETLCSKIEADETLPA
jgi:hypothetical protein